MIPALFRPQSPVDIGCGRKAPDSILRVTLGIHQCCNGHRPMNLVLKFLTVLLVLSAFCLLPGASAAPALVQDTTSVAEPGASVTGTFSSQPSAGNLLVAVVGNRGSVSIDSITSGWQTAIDESGNEPGQAIFYRVAGASEPTTFSVWYSGSTRLGLQLYEYSGMEQFAPLDSTKSSSGSGISLSTDSVTTSISNELVIAGFVVNEERSFTSWTNSFIERNDFANAGDLLDRSSYAGADKVAASASTYSTTATIDGSGSPTWRGQIVSFYPDGTVGVSIDNSTFSFGVRLANTWLTPDSSLIINNGQLEESFTCQDSQITDGSNEWTISAASNGSDQIRGQ